MKRTVLESALQKCKPFLMGSDFVPSLTHFCFSGDQITAYNDEQGITIDLDSGLNCTVPGLMMVKMLGTIGNEELTLDRGKDEKVTIKAGRAKIQLPSMEEDDYAFQMPVPNGIPLQVGEDFLRGLELCLISCATDPTYIELNGVTLILEDGFGSIYATDNRTLSAYDFEQELPQGMDGFRCILPTMFCEQLISLSKSYFESGVPSIDLYITEDTCIALITNSCTVFTRMVDASKARDFPSTVDRIVGNPEEIPYGEIPAEIVPALERAAYLKPGGDQEIHTEFTVTNNKAHMKTQSALGKCNDDMTFPNEIDWGNFSFEVNPALVARGFKSATHLAFYETHTLLLGNEGAFLHIISHRSGE